MSNSDIIYCHNMLQSQGILEVAVRNCVPLESFCLLVDRSGPLVLAQRNCVSAFAD